MAITDEPIETPSSLARVDPGSMTRETASTSVAALARAQVEAHLSVALARPRDFDVVRERVMKACKRPGFAEVARYSKPVGGKPIEGPSIRFVEEAIRGMGNVDVASPTIYDDDEKRIVRVMVSDLETNTHYSADITIAKTVERRQLRKDQKPISVRTNSYGDTVYLVAASDDELTVKAAALVSKTVRTLGLRLIPGDLVDEAMRQVITTQGARDAKDPDAAKRALVDAFGSIGVPVAEVKKYLGHELDTVSPAELSDLRAVYAAIKDGETTWAAVLATRETVDAATGEVTPAAPSGGGRAKATKDAVRAKAGAAAEKPQVETTGEPIDADRSPLEARE